MTGYVIRALLLFWICTSCAGCVGACWKTDTTKQEGVSEAVGQPNITVVEGTAITGPKHYAILKLADGGFITMESQWPKDVVGKHVRVTGIPEQIQDVPLPTGEVGQELYPGYTPMKAMKIEIVGDSSRR